MAEYNDARRAVVGIPMRDGKYLIGWKKNPRYRSGGCWALLGGHVEPGEGVAHALRREMLQEGGVEVGSLRHLMTVVRDGRRVSIIVCDSLTEYPVAGDDIETVAYVSKSRVRKLIPPAHYKQWPHELKKFFGVR